MPMGEIYNINDVTNGKIYKIKDNTNENVYYGITKQKYLSKRLGHHREGYRKYLDGKRGYMRSFEIIKNGDYNISLVEEFNYRNDYEKNLKERYYIENNKCVNKNIPGRTRKEYYNDNKEQILRDKSQKVTCFCCGSIVSKRHIARHKKSKKCLNAFPKA